MSQGPDSIEQFKIQDFIEQINKNSNQETAMLINQNLIDSIIDTFGVSSELSLDILINNLLIFVQSYYDAIRE